MTLIAIGAVVLVGVLGYLIDRSRKGKETEAAARKGAVSNDVTFLDTIENLGFSTWVRESPSKLAYPTVLWLHVMGMGVVAGISAMISLRLLGVSPKIPVKPLERLYPLIWFGFWVNAITGTALLMASASKRMVDPTFYVKMVFIFAGVAVLQLTRNTVFRTLGPDGVLPDNAKTAGVGGADLLVGSDHGRALAGVHLVRAPVLRNQPPPYPSQYAISLPIVNMAVHRTNERIAATFALVGMTGDRSSSSVRL